MKNKEYGYYFEKQGLSGDEGPIDPAQQYFEGSHADHAVVRETTQNTLDNPSKNIDGPIRMVFELSTMNTNDIPGIERLREHLDAVAEQTMSQQGHERMLNAAKLAKQETISVLRISDYNTTGLTGSETLAEKGSPISRLTRGKGGSSDDERGGSFGIGSAVGPMASDLSTVLYVSIPENSYKSVMAGYTRLATHTLNNTSYRAEGYFTRLDCEDDFEYQRPAPQIGTFSVRVEPGTDIYILGYRMAETDPKLERVRDAMIDNFMAAIKEKRLVVEGIVPGSQWTLDAETLPLLTKIRSEAHAFYQALQDDSPAEKTIENIGKVKLFINIDDSLEKKLHTITMRAPLMKIDTFKHNSIAAKYAAVLVCDSPEGNKYLRQLEPPQHHEWDAARDSKSGAKVIRDLKTFVRESLKERVTTEVGDEVKVEGLARFLPAKNVSPNSSGEPAVPTSEPTKEGTEAESSSVTGGGTLQQPILNRPRKKVSVKARIPAAAKKPRHQESGKPKEEGGGKPKGGAKKPRGQDHNPSEKGENNKPKGASRIRGEDVSFRSWIAQSEPNSSSVMALAITAKKSENGDLELLALGPGGSPEQDYELPISRAVIHLPDGKCDIDVSGNILKNLTLEAGKMIRVDIYMPAGERYRLGVI